LSYSTPEEKIANSAARTYSGQAGVARYGEKSWFNLAYNTQRGTYEIPLSEELTRLPFTRQGVRLTGGFRALNRPIEGIQYSYNYTDWRHDEVADGKVENQFFNKQSDYRAVFEQRRSGRLSGSFGGWGLRRDYKALGEEAITPPTVQNALAGFAVETLTISDKVRMQFGARVENNRFRPEGLLRRSFTGFSGGVGVNASIWNGGVFVANYNHSYRAPAIEELYARGPHVGNLTYEIGDDRLRRERGDGLDVSLRHATNRVRAELNYFYYRMRDFVFLAPTGEIEDGLVEAEYTQANSRYMGVDGKVQAALSRNLWLNLGFDAVNAELTGTQMPLPRIPPVRGRVGLDWRLRNLSVTPEVVMANQQTRIFETETETAGFAVMNLRGMYTITRQHAVHLFGVNFFNAGNRLYRNHLSFIKDIAPEIGRGVSFSYSVRFF
jgi:iron complex outermembrane recepter protein